MRCVFFAAVLALGCNDSTPPCAPTTPHEGGCGETFDVDYDPATQSGCSFNGGAGTPQTCASLCGDTASCELITFTSVECTTKCGD
jgi:hypothetical protein